MRGAWARSSRYLRRGTEAQDRWVEEALAEDEVPIAWMGVASATVPAGERPADKRATWRFLLTTHRAALVAFPRDAAEGPEVYDLQEGEVPAVRGSLGRDVVVLGPWCWRARMRNEALFAEVAPLVALRGIARHREAARLAWIYRAGNPEAVGLARRTLETAPLREPIDDVALAFLVAVDDRGPDEPLAAETAAEALGPPLLALAAREAGGEALVRWAQGWQIAAEEQLVVVELLLGLEGVDPAVAVPLHRQARAGLVRFERDLARRTLIDLSYAKHLLLAGERSHAVRLLEARLDNMPDESLLDLLPPDEVDLTAEGPQVVRIRLLELLVEARGEADEPDLEAVAELARLQPLVRSRIEDLRGVATGTVEERAAALLAVLEPGGGLLPEEPSELAAGRPVHALPRDLVERRIPHPAARAGGPFDWIQERLGKASSPDHGALRAYAERVTTKGQPLLAGVLADAALALGVSAVEGYVSRGERGTGLRAYDGSPPFVVIGGEHLDESSGAYMTPDALLFAVGTEVAHLRFGHTRLTSSEVWDGVFHKGTRLLEVVAAFAGPLGLLGSAVGGLARLAMVQRILTRAAWVSRGAGRAAEAVGLARGVRRAGSRTAEAEAASAENEIGGRQSELLAACRLMQLTADRAGLVLCGDIRAATRALFLVSSEHRAELAVAERHGLVTTLGRRDASGELMHQPLAVRIAALFSFFLSKDYEVLREAVTSGG